MRVVTTAQMREVEAYAIHKLGIPALLLMENAALGAAARINALDAPERGGAAGRTVERAVKGAAGRTVERAVIGAAGRTVERAVRGIAGRKQVTVVCGPGNNGGDGFALARKLFAGGWTVAVIFVGEAAKLGDDARLNLDILIRMGVSVHRYPDCGNGIVAGMISAADVVVDALFGIGLTRAPEGIFAEVIRMMNAHGRYIVALDIPSGVEGDTGHTAGEAVCANSTVTFGFMKPGLLLYPGATYAGEVFVADLSIPSILDRQSKTLIEMPVDMLGETPIAASKNSSAAECTSTECASTKCTSTECTSTECASMGYILTDADIPGLLPPRPAVSHKGSFGKVRIYAGSRDMPGAAVLCCAAAYRIGAGLVEVCAVEEVAQAVRFHVPEALATVLPGKNGRLFAEVAGDGSACDDTVHTDTAHTDAVRTDTAHTDAVRTDTAHTDAVRTDTACADRTTTSQSVLLIGPGLGQGAEVTAFVRKLLAAARCPVVLDADGLNAIAADPTVLRRMNTPGCGGFTACVVTPHPGEMSRLSGCSVGEIVANPIASARSFARTYGVYTLLKGARTVVAAPDGAVFINTTGSPALAKAGSGDALAGMIAGLLAQGMNMGKACALGAYLHGKAGERAGMLLSSYGVNAMDTIRILPDVLKGYSG